MCDFHLAKAFFFCCCCSIFSCGISPLSPVYIWRSSVCVYRWLQYGSAQLLVEKPVSSPIKLLFPLHAFGSFQDVNKHLFSSCRCRCVLIFSKLSITELFSKNAAFSSRLQSNHIKTCSLAEVIIPLIADVCNTCWRKHGKEMGNASLMCGQTQVELSVCVELHFMCYINQMCNNK